MTALAVGLWASMATLKFFEEHNEDACLKFLRLDRSNKTVYKDSCTTLANWALSVSENSHKHEQTVAFREIPKMLTEAAANEHLPSGFPDGITLMTDSESTPAVATTTDGGASASDFQATSCCSSNPTVAVRMKRTKLPVLYHDTTWLSKHHSKWQLEVRLVSGSAVTASRGEVWYPFASVLDIGTANEAITIQDPSEGGKFKKYHSNAFFETDLPFEDEKS